MKLVTQEETDLDTMGGNLLGAEEMGFHDNPSPDPDLDETDPDSPEDESETEEPELAVVGSAENFGLQHAVSVLEGDPQQEPVSPSILLSLV